MREFAGKRVLVMGMGLSGKAAAAFVLSQGGQVWALDAKPGEMEGVTWVDGVPKGIDVAIKSPGIPFSHPWVASCRAPVTSEVEIALERLKGKKLLGITGSNGKTTTTLLTTHILQEAGYAAAAAGNVGVPLIGYVGSDVEVLVVELSSFQLERLAVATFDAAILLNLTPNHLDRYGSFEEYAAAKWQLKHCVKPGGAFYLSSDHEKVAHILSLGYRERELPRHDEENFLSACLLCRHLGVSDEEMVEGLRTFRKPPHRLECVSLCNGVTYINDSKATSVDAVIAAARAVSGPVVLIAGGVDKGGAYADWIAPFRGKVKCVLLIGQAAALIERELAGHVRVEQCGTLRAATERACALAKEGDTVLLSPGCSSFDQFRDFEQRGEAFKTYVRELTS